VIDLFKTTHYDTTFREFCLIIVWASSVGFCGLSGNREINMMMMMTMMMMMIVRAVRRL